MTAGGISLALPEFCTKFAKNLCKPQIDHVIGLAHISDRRRGRRLFRRRDVSDDYFQGTLHGVRDRREPAHESARHPLRFAATARGGGRAAIPRRTTGRAPAEAARPVRSSPATDPIGAVPGRASPCPVRFGNRSAPSVAFLSFRRPFLEEGGKLPPGRFRTCTGIRFL